MRALAIIFLAFAVGGAGGEDDRAVAPRSGSRFEVHGGMARALQKVCASDIRGLKPEEEVAYEFLIEHAPDAYPALLDAMIREDRKAARTEAVVYCLANLEAAVRNGICFGYATDRGRELAESETDPLFAARRAVASRALAKAIAGGGLRGATAMGVLLQAGSSIGGLCPGLADAVRVATPALVKGLGVPSPRMQIPRDTFGAEETWDKALRAFSYGGADRALAEKPLRAFLAADATTPLAALALARMGADVSAETPHLARILDGSVYGRRQSPTESQRQLTLLADTVDALTALGKSAAAALPTLAAFLARVEMPGCHTLGPPRYVELVQAIATDATAAPAADALAPLLACDGPKERTIAAIVALGSAARPALLRVARDNAQTIAVRLTAVETLAEVGPVAPEPADRHLIDLLRAKAKSADELDRCRAEAGLPPVTTQSRPPAFLSCLSHYLCGPTKDVYETAVRRCCDTLTRNARPDLCSERPNP